MAITATATGPTMVMGVAGATKKGSAPGICSLLRETRFAFTAAGFRLSRRDRSPLLALNGPETCIAPLHGQADGKELAEEAVISEPVSELLFPVSRENTGKFANFGLEIAKAPWVSEENSIAYQQNSLVAKAGKICGRSGNPRRVTANLIPLTGLAFGATQSLSMRSF
jgi:hypothetical protein